MIPTLPSSGKIRIVENPDGFDLIDEDTLLIAINVGEDVLKALDLNRLPAAIITNELTTLGPDGIVLADQPKLSKINDRYESKELASKDTPGMEGRRESRFYWRD